MYSTLFREHTLSADLEETVTGTPLRGCVCDGGRLVTVGGGTPVPGLLKGGPSLL